MGYPRSSYKHRSRNKSMRQPSPSANESRGLRSSEAHFLGGITRLLAPQSLFPILGQRTLSTYAQRSEGGYR